MELLANELSVHEQFHDGEKFREALSRLMKVRKVARKFEREVHCHHSFLAARPMPGVDMQKAIGDLSESERRAAMSWMTRTSSFWEDLRQHGPDDWLECCGDVVTDSAIGEAAFRKLHGVDCGLVSITSCKWNYSPVEVLWRRQKGLGDRDTSLDNWWDANLLKQALELRERPFQSWIALREAALKRFTNLQFAKDCFTPLDKVPFARSAARRFFVLLGILERLACAFDADGERTAEGQQIYQEHFTGDNALFSDSSETEKRDFRKALRFPHPDDPGSFLFCPWHGKVRRSRPPLRLHFSWPIRYREPVHIVYAGPKRTRR